MAHCADNGEEEKAKTVTEAFPKVRIVIGGLDDSKILEDEAAKANVVIRESPIASLGHKIDTNNCRHCRCVRPRRRRKGDSKGP